MSNLAIIPARGGSKRIPRKNIKHFLGRPIIAYSIEAALKSRLFEEVMVSTDDKEIAEVAKEYGAKVPFYRSKESADDYATTPDVIAEVLLNYQKEGNFFKRFCCIYPTAPFISPKLLKTGYKLMIQRNYDSVFPIVQFNYPIQRALKINNGFTNMFWPENYSKRSQDFEPAYHDSGQFYWMWTEKFQEKKVFFTENSGSLILSNKEVQDIDNQEDWEIAEMKYRLSNKA